MGKFVNGLLGESSVNKMAEAMQVAPRQHPRDIIDEPLGTSERTMPQEPPEQAPEQAPEQMPPQQQAPQAPPQKPAVPVLSENAGEAMPEDTSGGVRLPDPSPDEEKQARVLLAHVVDYLYGDGLDVVSKSLKMPDKPVMETVGEIAAELVTSQMDAAEVANQQISPDILMAVGAEVVSQIYELASALGVWNPQSEEEMNADMGNSLSYATNLFVNMQMQTGRQDRLAGIDKAAKGIAAGEYDSVQGTNLPPSAAPIDPNAQQGGLL